VSGSGATQQVHILVKPTRADLMTNLIINTNLRTYHMELRSTERTYMASVSCQYPQDQLIALRRQNAQAEASSPVATGVDLANI
ncbi:TrbG/VirB9 family P-type conjugative transfer protein, partial [Escherichia coli]|nr:TrbG/VirB9 family P-type conjugative transfer protein [Escherichia coli]